MVAALVRAREIFLVLIVIVIVPAVPAVPTFPAILAVLAVLALPALLLLGTLPRSWRSGERDGDETRHGPRSHGQIAPSGRGRLFLRRVDARARTLPWR